MVQTMLALVFMVGCRQVEVEPPPTSSAACPPERCLENDFGTFDLDASTEIDGLCWSWTMDNDEPVWVNAVTATNGGWFHHSNWFWVPEADYDREDGAWPCSEVGFSELEATLKGGVVFAQSTQFDEETQSFVAGAAVEVGERARIIANSHLLNWSTDPVETSLHVRLDLLPESEVETPLAPFRLTYLDLQIPAGERSSHGAQCDLANMYDAVMGRPFDFRLHYVLPHFHYLGTGFRLSRYADGQPDEVLFELENPEGHPWGYTFESPIEMSDAQGLWFECLHDNPSSVDVGWGIGDQEMCVMLGFSDSGFKFDATVHTTDSEATLADGTVAHSGNCVVLGTPL